MGITTKMKAAIYSPYWETLGGGEYYCSSVAVALEKLGFEVELFARNENILAKLSQRFNLNFSQTQVNEKGYHDFTGSFLKKWRLTKKYDLIFFVSDGSIPWLFSRKNIIHFQVPFKNVRGSSFTNRLKLDRIDEIICNSKFTKSVIDQEYTVNSKVIYPAVIPVGQSSKKEKIILSVGRFDGNPKGKRQDILIDAFKKLNLKEWQLVLAGGVLDSSSPYFKKIKEKAKESNISIFENCSHQKLKSLYQKSSLYWHAHGFDTDIKANPWDTEHFGIAIVEAMSAGTIPLAFDAGGVNEIIDENSGYLWISEDELLLKTQDAIKKLDNKSFIQNCIQKSNHFSKGAFDEKFKKTIS